MFLLYEALLSLVLIVALPWFLVIGFLRGKYIVNFPERFGRYRGRPEPHDLWVHAVSVGEVAAAKIILDRVRALRPETTLVVTTTTVTGQALARRAFPDAHVTYFPLDLSLPIRRFLDHYSPRTFATVETEIWPNLMRHVSGRGIRSLLTNGRISDRSFPRYYALRLLIKPVLRRFEQILAREQTDRVRFVKMGADSSRVEVTGNVKFDVHPDPSPLAFEKELEALADSRPIFVAGSTTEGEDEMLLPEVQSMIEAGIFVVIAPRKPERFEIVAGLLSTAGIRFARRTEISSGSAADVLLLDSIGELARMYRHAVCAFVGGSLVPVGGHNPIEPAAAGCPVAFGPHMSNFREIALSFLHEAGAVEVPTAEALSSFVREMTGNPEARAAFSRRALATIEKNRGAAQLTAERIVSLLDGAAEPAPRIAMPNAVTTPAIR